MRRNTEVLDGQIPGRPFATPRETALILDIDLTAIYRQLTAGTIPGTKIGTRWRIPTAWLREQASGQGRPAA